MSSFISFTPSSILTGEVSSRHSSYFTSSFVSLLSSFLPLTPSSISIGEVSSRYSASFYSSFFNSCHPFYHLHFPPFQQEKCRMGILTLFPHFFFIIFIISITYTLQYQQGECHMGIMPPSPHNCFHYCQLLYCLHLPPYQHWKCHLGILPLFLIIFFILVTFSITYTFPLLLLRSRKV